MAKGMRVDFSGVDKEIRRGGRAAHMPEGDYLFKVVKHEVRKTKDGSGRYIVWQCQCVSKSHKGKTIYHNTSLKPEALWNLRNLIFACTGKNVAGKALEFVPTSLYGKIFAGTTEDDEYTNPDTGKTTIKSVLADIRSREEDDSDEDDEDTADDEDDDGDEDEEEDDDEDDEEDEEPAPPRKKKPSGKSSKKGSRKNEDDDEDDLEDIDVEDI